MDDRLIKSFVRFFRDNKRNRIENDGCAAWNEILTDLPFFDGKQPRISVVFTRYQGHTINATVVKSLLKTGLNASQEQVMGYVLALPSYWLEVDEYLAIQFIETYIDNFINANFDTGDGNTGGNCPVCPDDCPSKPPIPPCPPPPPPPPPPYKPPQGPFPPNPIPSPFLEPVKNPVVPQDQNIKEFNKP